MLNSSGHLRAGLLCPLVLGIAAALAGCGKASAPAPTPTPWLTSPSPTAATGKPSPTSGGTGLVSFKTDIQTIFQAHCAQCHIAIQSGGLNLGNYQGLITGGQIVPGSIVTPGNHAASICTRSSHPPAPGRVASVCH